MLSISVCPRKERNGLASADQGLSTVSQDRSLIPCISDREKEGEAVINNYRKVPVSTKILNVF